MDDFAVTGKFADPTIANVANSKTPSLYYYDESQGSLQGGWKPYPTAGLAQDNTLVPGLGYCALIREGSSPVVWDVTGTLNQGDIHLPVAITADMAPSNGWNLVGNPYPCSIDWDIEGPNGWTKENISPVFCIRDNGLGSWGNVRYWDGDVNYSDIPEGHIAAGQSFWVKAIGPNPQLIAREGAKVTNDASFYRKAESYIPSFVLILKKDPYMDKAYYKVRPEANTNFDEWDAIKIDNDNFDISTLSDDGFSLAINSRDSLPCGEKYVKVRVKDLKQGTYKLELDTRYDFGAYHYTWIDSYFGTETPLHPGEDINIEVTEDPVSKSLTRFALLLKEIIPADSQTVSAPTSMCTTGVISLTIQNTQHGIYYSVWENGRRLTTEHKGIGKDLIIKVHSDSIDFGTHRFDVVARSACHEITLTSHSIVKFDKVELSIPQYSVCEGETARLTVNSNADVVAYSWFASEISSDTLATGQSWTTPPLLKSQSYYVSAALSSGCNSDRQKVDVHVINAPAPAITSKDGDILCSNYLSNNLWLLDGVLMSNESELFVDQTGTYTLIVDTLGCVRSDSIEYINASVGSVGLADVDIFPNPVVDFLNLPSLDYPAQVEIIGSSGKICLNREQLEMRVAGGLVIDVKALASGTYFAVFRIGQRKRILKFVKVD
jgi:hypothetical protein